MLIVMIFADLTLIFLISVNHDYQSNQRSIIFMTSPTLQHYPNINGDKVPNSKLILIYKE